MLEDRLRAIPFLRDLPLATLQRAATYLRPTRCARGCSIFAAGDPADSLLLVESGWLEVKELGTDRVLASFGPGSVVGELGVLLDAPRVATVRAVTDAALWELRRADVDRLATEDAALALALSRETGRRLVATDRAAEIAPRIAVAPAPDVPTLARALVDEGVDGVGVLQFEGTATQLPAAVTHLRSTDLDVESALALVSSPTAGTTVVVGLPPEPTPATAAVAAAADFGVELDDALPAWAADRIHPLRRLPGGFSRMSRSRLARWVSGRAIGLVLSSGGSKTVAHVGVLRVLRDAGITIDAVAGASGGSVVAAAVARGISDAELEQWAHELAPAFSLLKLGPKVPPRTALFKGTGPLALFRSWHGNADITDCALPLYVVAADLSTGTEVIINRGPIADALRASMSIPGALEPTRWQGRLLVDGGIVLPLPARVLRDSGIRWVIGSDVAGQDPSALDEARTPSIVETMGRMVSTRERQLLGTEVALLDVHIRPVVRASTSFDFSTPDEFIAEGIKTAQAARPALERLVQMAAGA